MNEWFHDGGFMARPTIYDFAARLAGLDCLEGEFCAVLVADSESPPVKSRRSFVARAWALTHDATMRRAAANVWDSWRRFNDGERPIASPETTR